MIPGRSKEEAISKAPVTIQNTTHHFVDSMACRITA